MKDDPRDADLDVEIMEPREAWGKKKRRRSWSMEHFHNEDEDLSD
jgi:hypothetical protein